MKTQKCQIRLESLRHAKIETHFGKTNVIIFSTSILFNYFKNSDVY